MDLIIPSCLWSQRIFPSLPGSRLTIFLSRCKFSTLTTRQPMVEFYLLTFPRFPLRKKEHKSYIGKNRTHDFRTSRCAAYLLNHSGDEPTLFLVGFGCGMYCKVFVGLQFFWCPCMAINISVRYSGGLLPDIILLTQCHYHRGTRSNAMKRFCLCSL